MDLWKWMASSSKRYEGVRSVPPPNHHAVWSPVEGSMVSK